MVNAGCALLKYQRKNPLTVEHRTVRPADFLFISANAQYVALAIDYHRFLTNPMCQVHL